MFYRILADIVVFIHFLWILFLISGAFVGMRYRRVKIVHLIGIAFALIIQIFGWYCPLTYLEVWLRRMQYPSAGYSGSYIIHYVEKLVYVDVPPGLILIATVFIALISLIPIIQRLFKRIRL
jgi:hypothetical protein